VVPPEEALDQLATLLNDAERVTLLCGGGVVGAHREVVALAGRLQAPIVHTLRGKEHIEWANPYDVGMTGLIGFASGYHAMGSCDVLLMLGTDFPIASSIRRMPASPRSTCGPRRSAARADRAGAGGRCEAYGERAAAR
jgi:thiamine pyrophosphate-dependent acetolactate synthase large subunit-like protein